jgi:hypothetical protein
MSIPGIEDDFYQSLPLLDERGYEVLTDENGEPIAVATSCMQIEPVDVVSHTTFVVSEQMAQQYRRGQ